MHVSIDRVACAGVGSCAMTAPRVFGVSEEDALVELLDAEPDESERADVERAVLLCPNEALALSD